MVMSDEVATAQRGIGGLLRLWTLLFVSYVCVKLSYDLLVMGYLDVRPRSLAELVVPHHHILRARRSGCDRLYAATSRWA